MSEAFRNICLHHQALYETFICYFVYLFIYLFFYIYLLNLVKKGILEFGFITATDV